MWKELLEKVTKFDFEELILCQKPRAPRHLNEAVTSHFDVTPEIMYHRPYFEVVDMIIGEIQRHFEIPFTFYAKVESLLKNAATGLEMSKGVKQIARRKGS